MPGPLFGRVVDGGQISVALVGPCNLRPERQVCDYRGRGLDHLSRRLDRLVPSIYQYRHGNVARVLRAPSSSEGSCRGGPDPYGVGAILGALYDVGLSGEERGWELTGAIKTAERKPDDKSLRHSGQNLMAWAVANARVEPKATPSSSPSRHLARRRSTHCPFPTYAIRSNCVLQWTLVGCSG